jgi:uncharacterized caspase-like protein
MPAGGRIGNDARGGKALDMGAGPPARALRRLAWVLAAISLALGACATPSPNVALVVGNGAYQHAAPLPNPPNDARLMSDLLNDLGWDVITLVDRPADEFHDALDGFADRMEVANQGIFFYAGHGMQIDGRNYLVPVEFSAVDASVHRDLISLDESLALLDRDGSQLAVFLDACRDNPLSDDLERNVAAGRGIMIDAQSSPRNVSMGTGLAEVSTGAGTFVAYATEPGNVAVDGDGSNSPFTKSLVKYIGTRNKDLVWVLQRVRSDVMRETAGEQIPWDHSSLTRDFIVREQHRTPPPP